MSDGWIFLLIFFILLLLPFIPSFLEIFKKRDITPLDIDQDYVKDPAYFGRSFLRLLEKILDKITDYDRIYKISLSSSQEEKLIKKRNTLEGGEYHDLIIYMEGNKINNTGPVHSNKEMVVMGDFAVDYPLTVRALLVKGNLYIKAPFKVFRWVYVEEEVEIKAPSHLGVSFFSSKSIKISANSKFKRLFAREISVGQAPSIENTQDQISLFKGTIRSHGNLNIKSEDKKLIIEGDIISDKNINVENNVWIKGNVFSHVGGVILKNCIIGEPGKIKTIFGKKYINLFGGIKIYGYLHTEGEGIINI